MLRSRLNRPRPDRRPHRRASDRTAQAAATSTATDGGERGELERDCERDLERARTAGGPLDNASYSCSCGFIFTASVSTSVACPHCGARQAW